MTIAVIFRLTLTPVILWVPTIFCGWISLAAFLTFSYTGSLKDVNMTMSFTISLGIWLKFEGCAYNKNIQICFVTLDFGGLHLNKNMQIFSKDRILPTILKCLGNENNMSLCTFIYTHLYLFIGQSLRQRISFIGQGLRGRRYLSIGQGL